MINFSFFFVRKFSLKCLKPHLATPFNGKSRVVPWKTLNRGITVGSCFGEQRIPSENCSLDRPSEELKAVSLEKHRIRLD